MAQNAIIRIISDSILITQIKTEKIHTFLQGYKQSTCMIENLKHVINELLNTIH